MLYGTGSDYIYTDISKPLALSILSILTLYAFILSIFSFFPFFPFPRVLSTKNYLLLKYEYKLFQALIISPI